MKTLLQILIVCVTSLLASGQSKTAPVIARNASERKLAVVPHGPDCFVGAVERGDPSKEPTIMFMQGKAGCIVPWHWHPSTENIMLVKGSARAEMKDTTDVLLKAGGFLSVPPHHPMRFRCISACELFVSTDGPFVINYIDSAGKDISAEEALRQESKHK